MGGIQSSPISPGKVSAAPTQNAAGMDGDTQAQGFPKTAVENAAWKQKRT